MAGFENVIQEIDKDVLKITLNTDLYTKEAVFKTCYWFTDKCYLFLDKEDDKIIVFFKPKKEQSVDLNTIASDFLNELINQRVRTDVNNETGKIRELIVAQAFAEVNLLPKGQQNGSQDDYISDPLEIGSLKGK